MQAVLARDRAPVEARSRWVLMALQLPARPSNTRVKLWRRLQQLGAVPVKHAVYVLPHSIQALEDFAWLRTEAESHGGQASIFTASVVDGSSDEEIVDAFQAARTAEYDALATDLERMWRHREDSRGLTARAVRPLRERFESIRARDFYSAPIATKVEARLLQLEGLVKRSRPQLPALTGGDQLRRSDYAGRVWVTRPRPGVDRFASAWLIRRFIDPNPTFRFQADPPANGQGIAFDMYNGTGFSHEADRCTFEVLQVRFSIRDPRVSRIAELVHDLDFKDHRYRAPHAATLDVLVEGLRSSIADDATLLEHGCALFEALYAGLAEPQPPGRRAPRLVKTRRR